MELLSFSLALVVFSFGSTASSVVFSIQFRLFCGPCSGVMFLLLELFPLPVEYVSLCISTVELMGRVLPLVPRDSSCLTQVREGPLDLSSFFSILCVSMRSME